ncbi:MAG: NFACT family protein [Lachnospiraceae bacterium]|nr:NFACT family protein [Lachnospiraceae bacterium]
MALDGIVISGIVHEMKGRILGGRIYKIYQPEVDEICIVIKNRVEDENTTSRLVISADASLPLIYLTNTAKENPVTAPNFCMLLRKHIGNGRIVDIAQPMMERIVEITIEHLDELGDLCSKKLIVEIMGKHSNIIFADAEGTIIDSIKHISHQISSVREVLPGRCYEYPPSQNKKNPLEVDVNFFMNHVLKEPCMVSKAIYTTITGISPVLANEICYRADIDGSSATASLSLFDNERLYKSYEEFISDIKNNVYYPCIAYEGYMPKEFSVVKLTMYGTVAAQEMPSAGVNGLKAFEHISQVIEEYYSKKSVVTRMKQRSIDLRKIVSNAIERTAKKYDLQMAQLKDTEKRDKYKVYGELITAYGYGAKPGDRELVCENYYTGEEITIPLDPELTAMECGKKYFAKYNKQKRTYEALTELIKTSKEELDYLMSVESFLAIATSESDLKEIKKELVENGYIKGRVQKGKGSRETKSKPLHYISSDGFHMYVGKNNLQNEELTFKLATGNDMWFHAKNMPGSHVIVKLDGATELPDRTYEEAARLAAYYSTGNKAPKVDIDYTAKKNLKKPPRSMPGFVIYHTNYSMTIEPDIHGIQEVN